MTGGGCREDPGASAAEDRGGGVRSSGEEGTSD